MTNDTNAKRQPCQVYTRVMGYLRPVCHYNIGKKSEFYSRKYFQESVVNQLSSIDSSQDGLLKKSLTPNAQFISKN